MTDKDATYVLLHLGEDNLPYNAVNPPIFQTSNFCFDSFDSLQEALEDELSTCLYTRGNNPTVNLVEEKIAGLEHGEKAKLLGSGAAAITNAIMSCVSMGDHVICVKDAYSWATKFIGVYLERFGVEHTFVNGTDTATIAAAIRPTTRVIYLESPTSNTFLLQDIAAITKIAKDKNITTIIDNTWATPFYCNPIDFGVDLVVHSASKYLGGNSDLVAGVVIGKRDKIDHMIKTESLQFGAVADPFMAWLVLRGMRTLHVRLPAHFAGALAVGHYLEQKPEIESVSYPFLESHPQFELANKQMRGGSGLLSFRLRTRNLDQIKTFINSFKVFKRAVSWGGYESLIMPEAASFPTSKIPEEQLNLVRIHVGLESPSLLIEDFERAFSVMGHTL